jgi:hypothetical protein
MGGVRSTYVDVPVAKYGVPNAADPRPGSRADFVCAIAGYETPLAAESLRAMYKSKQDYVSQVERRLKQLIDEGWFLPVYADQVIGDASRVDIR